MTLRPSRQALLFLAALGAPCRSLDSLQQVIEFYDRGGNTNPALDSEIRPLRFTADEKRALVAFLSSLTGRISEGERSIFP